MLNGLKFRIISSYVILLCFGMFLTDAVVVALWQKSMVRFEVQAGLFLLENIVDKPQGSAEKIREKISAITGGNCLQSAFFYNNTFTLYQTENVGKSLRKTVRFATTSTTPVIRYYGKTWGVFSPAHRYVVVARKIRTDSSYPASIGLLYDLKPIYKSIWQKQKVVLVYMLINVMVLSVLGLFRMIESIVKPLENLVNLADEYHGGNLDLYSPQTNGQEFRKLAFSLNSMVKRIDDDREKLKETVRSLQNTNELLNKSQKKVIASEKMATVGIFSAGMAHEIGNPLGVVQGYLELLNDDTLARKERDVFISRAVSEIDRVNQLIRQLLDFAGSADSDKEIADIEKLLSQFDSMLAAHKKMQGIDYSRTMDIDGPLFIQGRGAALQVLLNCLLNAIDAVSEKKDSVEKKIILSCHQQINDGVAGIKICIEDNGIGIESDKVSTVFDPFYTTKEVGKGTGLGLSVSYSLVKSMSGEIWITSVLAVGTIVHLFLPVYPEIAAIEETRKNG